MTVLVIEDDAALRRLMELRLRLDGFNVVSAEDGRRAMDGVDEARPDVVVTDLMMPVLDGFAFCREVRGRDDSLRDIPIVVLTAHQRDSAIDRLLELGGIVYMSKPFDPPLLAGTLRDMVRSRSSGSAA